MHAKRFQVCLGRINEYSWSQRSREHFFYISLLMQFSVLLALPSSHNDVVHGNTKANRREERNREERIIIAEQASMCKQSKSNKTTKVIVCVSTIDDVCSVCVVYANSNHIRKYVQFAGWIRSSSNWGNNARNRYRIAVCAFVHWFAGWTFFTSLISTAAPAWFVFARYIFIIYLQIIMESNKNNSRNLHP